MPRGRKRMREVAQPTIDPKQVLTQLIEKAQEIADHDIWNHTKNARGSKHRMTEAEQDDELMHEADMTTKYVHLDKQPEIIVNGNMRSYQVEGLNWLVNLRASNLHGILADEMGLGKTLQTISLLAYLRETEKINGKHLICVPKSTVVNWIREFTRWCPSINVFALDGEKEVRKALVKNRIKNNQDFDVIVCGYEVAMIEKAALRKINWSYIIVDEAHRLKNNASKFARILREFTSNHRLLITGTPLQNNLSELWSLLHFLMPVLFTNSDEFDLLFDRNRNEEEQEEIFKLLRFLLAPFLLRRLKVDVERDMPPKTETIILVGLSTVQTQLYKQVLMGEIQTLHEGGKASKTRLLNLVMQLRKVCNHPYLFDGVEDLSLDPFGNHLVENGGKLALLDKLLPRLKEQQSRVLIFSQMTRVLDILEDYCVAKGHLYSRIDGQTKGEDRQEQMDVFNEEGSEKFVFLLTTRAGGLGINLQTADIVIIFDSDWNPQMDLQAMDRAHRIGQTKPVKVYRLVTQGTVEECMLERAELKLRLDAAVIQKGRQVSNSKQKSKTNLLDMINYGADKIFRSEGTTITEDDIEDILYASEQQTVELKEKWEDFTQKKFNEFTDEFDYRVFEEKEFSKDDARLAQHASLVGLIGDNMGRGGGRRQMKRRRRNYDIDAYYRERMNGFSASSVRSSNANNLAAPRQLPNMRYWQFFNAEQLHKFSKKEWNFFLKYRDSPKYEEGMKALTDEEEKEYDTILQSGFVDVAYRDLGTFVRACIKHGKDNIDEILSEFEDEYHEVIRKYHAVFFEKAPRVRDLETQLERIEEAEAKRANREERLKQQQEKRKAREEMRELRAERARELTEKRAEKERLREERAEEIAQEFRTALEERVESWLKSRDDPNATLRIPSANGTALGYSKFVDRALFLKCYEFKYDRWDEFHRTIVTDPRFCFDFFVRSRTPAELKMRVDQIIRAILHWKRTRARKNGKNSEKSSEKMDVDGANQDGGGDVEMSEATSVVTSANNSSVSGSKRPSKSVSDPPSDSGPPRKRRRLKL